VKIGIVASLSVLVPFWDWALCLCYRC